MPVEIRNAFLISGGGTTMAEMMKAINSGQVPNMEVACVIASKASAGGIQKAIDLGVNPDSIAVIEPKSFRGGDGIIDQEGFGQAILAELRKHGTDTVTQNGWLPLTPSNVIDTYSDSIFNQHPGPLPDFGQMYGKQVHAAVLEFGRAVDRRIVTMATAQRVAENYDDGAVVLYETINVEKEDSVDDLQQRVLPREHASQILLLQQIARGTVREVKPPRIVFSGEERILFEAKKTAVELYPHG